LQLKVFSEIITNISPFALNFIAWKQKADIVIYFQEPCNWQHLPFIALSIPAWSQPFTRLYRTREAIWEFLRDAFMSQKSEKEWLHTADESYERTNFPNYLGTVDGKHIRLCKPDDSRSLFFNYKNFSTVLMALVNADYWFMSIDVGVYLVTATSLRVPIFVKN
jgi:hypothetical protein